MLSHDQPEPTHLVIQPPAPEESVPAAPPEPSVTAAPPPTEPKVPASPVAPETLTDIEQAVQSPHVANNEPAQPEPKQPGQIHIDEQGNLITPEESTPTVGTTDQPPDVDSARSAVLDAINSTPAEDQPLEPTAASGASGYLSVNPPEATPPPTPPSAPEDAAAPAFDAGNEPAPGLGPADKPMDMPLPPNLTPPPANPVPPTSNVNDPTAPPPVPPPMMPPGFINPNQQ